MSRLIDADALMEKLTIRYMEGLYPEWRQMDYGSREKILRLANAFKNALNAAPTEDSWISVKDGLPQEDGYYIVYDGDSVEKSYYDAGVWMWENGENMYCVTHWQPLPEAPKMEKEQNA